MYCIQGARNKVTGVIFSTHPAFAKSLVTNTDVSALVTSEIYSILEMFCATFLNKIKKKRWRNKLQSSLKKRNQFSFADFCLIIIVTLFSFLDLLSFSDIWSKHAHKNKRQLYFRQL